MMMTTMVERLERRAVAVKNPLADKSMKLTRAMPRNESNEGEKKSVFVVISSRVGGVLCANVSDHPPSLMYNCFLTPPHAGCCID